MSRRRLLQAGAVGAGVAGASWITPSVLAIDRAAAVGTCPSGSLTFNWSTGGNGVRHTGAILPFVGNVGGLTGVDIRIISTAQNGVVAAGIVGDNWMTRSATSGTYPPQIDCGTPATVNWPRGNQGSFYSLLMNDTTANDCTNAGNQGRYVEVEFGFFVPGSLTQRLNVRNLTFNLLDIDASTNNYRDRVTVAINGAAITAPATVAPPATNQVVATRAAGGGATMAQPGGTAVITAIAGSSSAATATTGNIELAFNATLNVSSVRVRFTDVLGADPETIQWVGIGDLTFCKFGLVP